MHPACCKVLTLGANAVYVHEPHLTTVLPSGARVEASPNHREQDYTLAGHLGYGHDTWAMSRDHEVIHTLLALARGLPCSPALQVVAGEAKDNPHCEEEALVLALQRYLKTGVVESCLDVLRCEGVDYRNVIGRTLTLLYGRAW